jgi:hypothetical protein
MAPDFLNHMSGKRGIEDFLPITGYVQGVFPDGQITIDQEIAEGDLVFPVITSTGTQTGELRMPLGINPSDQEASILAERTNLLRRLR